MTAKQWARIVAVYVGLAVAVAATVYLAGSDALSIMERVNDIAR